MLTNFQKSPQVGWITAVGAAVNDATIHEFEHKINIADDGWSMQEHDILYVHLFTLEPQPSSFECHNLLDAWNIPSILH